MSLIEKTESPSSGFRLLLALAGLFSLLCLFAAIKFQISPELNDETPMALGMAAPTYGVVFILLCLGAVFPYKRKWRFAFLAPLATFICALLIAAI